VFSQQITCNLNVEMSLAKSKRKNYLNIYVWISVTTIGGGRSLFSFFASLCTQIRDEIYTFTLEVKRFLFALYLYTFLRFVRLYLCTGLSDFLFFSPGNLSYLGFWRPCSFPAPMIRAGSKFSKKRT
jgi:hypothetical protein